MNRAKRGFIDHVAPVAAISGVPVRIVGLRPRALADVGRQIAVDVAEDRRDRPAFLGHDPVEDWLNHVIPALMLFRTYVAGHDLQLSKLTIDAHSSTGIDAEQAIGIQPMTGPAIPLSPPTNNQFGEQNLREWVDTVPVPYAQ